MKKVFITTLGIVICFFGFSQNGYYPLIDQDSKWSILEKSSNQNGIQQIKTFEVGIDEQDTLIDDKAYNLVYISDGNPLLIPDVIGYIREDISEKKLYFRSNIGSDENIERLMYDFSAQLGDTVEVFSIHHFCNPLYEVVYVDTIMLADGIYRKVWELKLIDFSGPGVEFVTWIEGVGSLQGLVFPGCYQVATLGISYDLLCFKRESENIYLNPEYDSCYYEWTSSIEDFSTDSGITIYPNPVKDILFININTLGLKQDLLLLDIYGKQVKQGTITGSITEMDVSNLDSGIYILKIQKGQNCSFVRFVKF